MKRSRFAQEQITGALKERQAGATAPASYTTSARRHFTRDSRSVTGRRHPTPTGGVGWRRRTPRSRSC